jgi:hypothetical protein
MIGESAIFETMYTPESIREAAYTFRDYQFRHYGPLLIVACIVNAVGLTIALWFGMPRDAIFWFFVFVVVVSPMWLVYMYLGRPYLDAARLRMTLAPSGKVTVGPEGVVLPLHRGQLKLSWTRIKAVQEKDNLFLLVVSPLFSYFVPTSGMPDSACELLRSRARLRAS